MLLVVADKTCIADRLVSHTYTPSTKAVRVVVIPMVCCGCHCHCHCHNYCYGKFLVIAVTIAVTIVKVIVIVIGVKPCASVQVGYMVLFTLPRTLACMWSILSIRQLQPTPTTAREHCSGSTTIWDRQTLRMMMSLKQSMASTQQSLLQQSARRLPNSCWVT